MRLRTALFFASAAALGSCTDDVTGDPVCTSSLDCAEPFAITSRAHVPEPVVYSDVPPAGGDHSACWAPFGVHRTEVLDERWVHNLEHGGVVVLYDCPGGCADDVAALEALAPTRPFLLVTPYAALPTRFAVVAWGVRLLTDTLDPAAFARFYEVHAGDAPEHTSAPPPSTCL